MAYEVHSISPDREIPIPQGITIQLMPGCLPGCMDVTLKLSESLKPVTFFDLRISNNTLYIPFRSVFISYAKEDSEFALSLNSRLMNKAIFTWIDTDKILPGINWKSAIDDAIASSHFVIILLSKNSYTKTGYFQREIKYAIDQQVLRPNGELYIIPLILDDLDIPREFKDIHCERVSSGQWFDRIIKSIYGRYHFNLEEPAFRPVLDLSNPKNQIIIKNNPEL